MAKLISSLDGQTLSEYPLDKERITIGRRSVNDIRIDNLAVSGEHAAIITIDNDSFLEDLESTNGTMVNGQVIKKHVLQQGDVIEIGKYRLKYENGAQDGVPTAEDGNTMLPQPPTASVEASPQPTTVTEEDYDATLLTQPLSPTGDGEHPASLGHIQILNGPNPGRELPLTKVLTTMGKPGVQVAVIARRSHGYFITHVEGQSRPSVNGKIIGVQAHPLNDHDIIDLAGIKMEFFLG